MTCSIMDGTTAGRVFSPGPHFLILKPNSVYDGCSECNEGSQENRHFYQIERFSSEEEWEKEIERLVLSGNKSFRAMKSYVPELNVEIKINKTWPATVQSDLKQEA